MQFRPRGRAICLLILVGLLLWDGLWVTGLPVGAEQEPKVVDLYATDPSNNARTVFKVGGTVVIWIAILNEGSDLDFMPQGPVVWIEVAYTGGTVPVPMGIQFAIQRIPGGGHKLIWGAGFQLDRGGLPVGRYTANAFVSDKLIAAGGKFYNARMSFDFFVTNP